MDRYGTSRTLAVLLIAAGALLLGIQVFGGTVGFLWPFFIIVPGLMLLVEADRAGWHSSSVATGAVIAGVGVILLFQNMYDYYRSWAYAWTLLPLFAGAGFYYTGVRHDDAQARGRGQAMIMGSAVAFLVFAALFELMIFDGGNGWGRILVPVLLIGVGALMLTRGNLWPRGGRYEGSRNTPPPSSPASGPSE